MKRIRVRLVTVLMTLLAGWPIEGIGASIENAMEIPAFLREDKNNIVFNGADWSPLFAEMAALQLADTVSAQVVSIVHIGDSHLQAGFLTEAVRIPLQRDFGNAGRGLVVPLKLANTNEPRDYSINSTDPCDFGRCVGGKKSQYELGVGGVAVVSTTGNIELTFSTVSREGDCDGFRTMRLFHAPIESFPGMIAYPVCVQGESCAPFLTRFSWDEAVCSVQLLGLDDGVAAPLAIYGASLETGEKGILYHTIGNNGAFYSTYAGVPQFAEQVAALSPHLIVVSLGTNESFSTNLTSSELYKQIDNVVTALRRESPQSLILLTTPAECARRVRRRYSPNSRVDLVCETIKSYAQEYKLAYWDWYEVAGGKGSSKDWCAGGYMAYDHTHCTESGYRLQGEMLYRTLMKAYQEYVDGVAK